MTTPQLTHSWEGDYKITLSSGQQVLNIATPHGQERADQPVMLLQGGTDGFSVKPDLTRRATVNKYGERVVGKKLPPFGGTMKVVVGNPALRVPLAHIDRQWRRTWSPFVDTVCTVTATDGGNAWARFRLVSMTDVPNNLRGRPSYPCDVSWSCLDGVWFGKSRTYTGSAEVRDTSDSGLSPIVSLEWDTSQDLAVTFPDGRRVSFARSSYTGSLPSVVRFNMEPGMMGQPTEPGGATMYEFWPVLEGKMRGVELTPREASYWNLSGCTLRVTPRYLHPWR
ncbi:hypothetical protein [Corynebacterium jeddahense]|uniref:Minor tail protein n=1 Tax=Corynebacterium jeddahense TaxID=1414719 RepID=A0ABY7UJG2_9CORY|nr:hypothetical protein [Corynebacterium jeddahense]WCZ37859.1 hypothetical protein CJEDD_01160 [Corynebacterium jeddahense]